MCKQSHDTNKLLIN